MKYKIEQYKEEYIEDQYKIAMKTSEDWNFFGPTPPKGLREAYSVPDFDPETRFYCFFENKMVGYVSSRVLGEVEGKIRADMSYPMVLKGYEDAFEILYEKAIETLKTKGVEIVRMEACDKWGSTIEFVEKSNYQFTNNKYLILDYHSDNYDESVEIKNAVEYTNKKDSDKLLNYFMNIRGFTEERSRTAINAIEDVYVEDIFAHVIYVKENTIHARGLGGKITDSIVNFYFTDPNNKHDKELFAKIMEVLKKRKVKILQAFLGAHFQKDEDRYLKLGFKRQGEVKLFEKEL